MRSMSTHHNLIYRGGWTHTGTIADKNESVNSNNHVWSSMLNNTQSTGIWEDSTTYGTLSLYDDYKSLAWSTVVMNQFLIKDNGTFQRNLFKTNNNQISRQTLSSFFLTLQWASFGSESSNSAFINGRVKSLDITTYNINDNVIQSSFKSKILLKFGEKDGVQDTNKDRVMIAWQRYDMNDTVDAPSGIGCFTLLNGVQYYRDIVPLINSSDYPPNSITGSPYSYSIWVK